MSTSFFTFLLFHGYHGKNNVWEYYFEPVSTLTYIPNDIIHRTYEAPDKFFIKWEPKNFEENFSPIFRKFIGTIIEKYIKVQSNIYSKIFEFYENYMIGKKTIGIHIRGTDKVGEAKPVPLERFITIANQFKDCQFLIASDECRILAFLKHNLKGPVISYQATCSQNNKPIHYQNVASKALLGEEVLIEAQLLSLCDVFIHATSNVALGVLFFNPDLEHIFLEA